MIGGGRAVKREEDKKGKGKTEKGKRKGGLESAL